MKGKFITLEGPDGRGKTTISKIIINELEKKGYKVLLTREPGGVEIAEQIRNIILDKNNVKMDSKTEALLYAAARRQHLVEKVLPALKKGQITDLGSSPKASYELELDKENYFRSSNNSFK